MAVLALSACVPVIPEPASDRTVHLNIVNFGRGPFQCRLMFGHWVDRDLGTVEASDGDDGIVVDFQQQPSDGALYVMRDDGQRRMMVENIFCARKNDWRASVGQIDVSALRVDRATDWKALCYVADISGRLFCTGPQAIGTAD
jgi:hypothetical protein